MIVYLLAQGTHNNQVAHACVTLYPPPLLMAAENDYNNVDELPSCYYLC
jgi:hypothetical protein